MQHLSNSLRNRLSNRQVLLASLAAFLTAGVGLSHAQPRDVQQGQLYQSAPAVSERQAQLVVMRKSAAPSDAKARDGAHVYVDGSFNTALLPGTFTRFCVPAGTHTVEAYISDAPHYAGKTNPKTKVDLAGGKTYFVAVSDQGTGELVPYKREDMERLLASSHELRYMENRAASVVACDVVAAAKIATYTFNSDLLFRFNRGDAAAISGKGRDEIAKVASDIRQKSGGDAYNVVVRGHADPIGSASANLRLSQQRAQTVRQLLIGNGVPARWVDAQGLGSTNPVVQCSPGRATPARIECNAPNRRVEVNVTAASKS